MEDVVYPSQGLSVLAAEVEAVGSFAYALKHLEGAYESILQLPRALQSKIPSTE